jgi:hypothetical protein
MYIEFIFLCMLKVSCRQICKLFFGTIDQGSIPLGAFFLFKQNCGGHTLEVVYVF